MSELTIELAADAKELVEEEGRLVQLFKLNRTPDDSTKPWRGTSSQPHQSKGGAEIPVIMAFVPGSASVSAEGGGFGKLLQNVEGSLAIAADQVGLLASDSIPAPFTPEDIEQCDKMRDGKDVWSIVSRGHLAPSGNSVLFVLGLKR